MLLRHESSLRMTHSDQFRVVTFVPTNNDNLLSEIEVFRSKVTRDFPEDKRIKNYYQDRLSFADQKLISLLFVRKKVVGFSTVFNNPNFYPPGVSRFLNRYYIHPQYRMEHKSFFSHTVKMLRQQLELSKDCGVESAMITTELFKVRWFKQWLGFISQETGVQWQFDQDKAYQVCDCPEALSCWQHVGYCSLTENDTFGLGLNSMLLQNVKERFSR